MNAYLEAALDAYAEFEALRVLRETADRLQELAL